MILLATSEDPMHVLPRKILNADGAVDCTSVESYIARRQYWFTDAPPSFLVALLSPNGTMPRSSETKKHDKAEWITPHTWTLIKYQLYQASYLAKFRSVNTQQSINIVTKSLRPMKKIIKHFTEHCRPSHSPKSNAIINYVTMMTLMGQIVAGRFTNPDLEASQLNRLPKSFLDSRLTYTSDFDDIKFLERTARKDWPGVKPYLNGKRVRMGDHTVTLAEGLEELFENITLSMFAYPQITNSTQRMANVTSWTPVNRYEYSWQDLVSSYGCGLLATAVVVLYACFVVADNKASHQTRPSTYLRTMHPLDMDFIAHNASHDGAEPLPRLVAATKLRLGVFNRISDTIPEPGAT